MATVVVVDESILVIPASAFRALLVDRARWATWWPGSEAMLVHEDEPLAWRLTGALIGSSSVATVPAPEGLLVRYTLEADPAEPGSATRVRRLPDSPHGRREVEALAQRHRVAWKRSVFTIAAQYEVVVSGRRPG